ncbi:MULTISPECIES: peptidoglycan-binding protein LysM [Acinetobacter]|uniref:Peptidoglycan-binding protein LysM n=1 Tax=Acinetobacter pollinis TaxID=2605270 RepID=A0ABU6DRM0_9GAMM|nr:MULTISPECIES: peptidoglycan-binding protein LysM [Acinetobacter]MBF7689279.1 peptidoglycan-binding protein LysM [Acinetobacter pollinis]MBF7691942.1 peptidoglycan-binding protein LysM [Acinetobacter pollinis]MBF7696824.1 peptidoglycan-binding protein LysM [Acinetobacter pollinis]MBF7700047.1 peptidoglycan-binding protein LysM [Acinetobacter pollinis]MEB5476501.1 peptidoglycan-binding protein LysM [Acinetobacter pollinis]
MGLFDFVKGIGKKLEGKTEQEQQPQQTQAAEPTAQEVANQLLNHIQSLGLGITGLSVTYNSDTDTAVIKGQAHTQADKEKVVLAAGNVEHVAQVDDQMTVEETATDASQPESQFYTVQSGDTLSKISKEVYGDANQYNKIFEANQPLLKDVNSIFPGQVLRIPQ